MMWPIEIFRPKIVEKGWGREEILYNGNFCGKLLVFNKDAEFSCHYHIEKDEVFYLLEGRIRFTHFDLENAIKKTIILNKGDCILIPKGQPHQIKALEPTTIIEVSTHHSDSDSYRIAKGDSQK